MQPTLRQKIIDAQGSDSYFVEKHHLVGTGQADGFSISSDGLSFERRLCVSVDTAIKANLFNVAHSSPFSMHHGSTKMYQDLNESIGVA